MVRVFVVTALEKDGDWIVRAEVGEVDAAVPRWIEPPKPMQLEDLMTLIETPNTLVTSTTRSGTVGPTLRVATAQNGQRTVEAIQLPGVVQNLDQIRSIIR